MKKPKRILFVCLGNIVRSPLAENLFRYLARQKGLDSSYEVDSAGTSAYHVGEPPDVRMRRTAAGFGLDYDGTARQFQTRDFDRFDLIVAMDLNNRDNLLTMARNQDDQIKIRLMREFDPESAPEAEVPDPYYGGLDGFEKTYAILERSVRGLLEAIEDGGL
ncbi:MAG: low molecular weight protein-tyrosine-phosphatase [Anaerolineales bacterium]|jgi:protein-tyrosine phosphatase